MARNDTRKIRLGIGLQGGGGHWRDPDVADGAAADIRSYIEYARIGEAGKFDFGFIADSSFISHDSTWPFLTRLEPVTALSAISSVTTHLGLIGTMTTSFSEPFTTARQLASLDKVSGGRAGWNAVTSALEGLGRNHGHDKLHDHALRYRIANEYLEVTAGLWDSWEDDAFVRDRANNVYVDFDKMHTLNHKGEFFAVQGPLNIERSPQGRPVQFQAGASEAGRDLAARHADGIYSNFSNTGGLEGAAEFYKDIKRRAVAHGREPGDILIFPSFAPIVGDTPEQAREIYERGKQFIDIEHAVKYLGRYFNFFDFSQFPLDEPLPKLGEEVGKNGFTAYAEHYKKIAREQKLTLRQLALIASSPADTFVGTAEYIADKMQEAFEFPALDGFVLHGTHKTARAFVEKVVPVLQKRGLFRNEYESTTFRGNLGLRYPVNRYAGARAVGKVA